MITYPILPEYDLRKGDKLVSLVPYSDSKNTHFSVTFDVYDTYQYEPWPYRCTRDSDGEGGLYSASELGITVEQLCRIKLRTVYEHLISMGSPSVKKGYAYLCMYRGAFGKQCAVGCIIPDERYDKSLEGKTANITSVVKSLGLPFVPPDAFVDALRDMQKLHDEPVNWRKNRKGLKSEFKKRAKGILDNLKL